MARLPGEAGVMPVVRLPRAGLPAWMIAAIAVVAAILLFIILDSRRRAPTVPAVPERSADSTVAVPPPPLLLPQPAPPPQVVQVIPPAAAPAPAPQQPRIIYVPQPMPMPVPAAPEPAPPPPRVATEAALVFDASVPAAAAAGAAEGETAPAAPGSGVVMGTRARAGVFANRSTTVAQGTLIPAVLETALNSTRPGLARAIVSRDVRGFDGTRVLIPRGSRLIGEYRSEATPGQRRALVNWVRLIRPDGVTMAIGSPAGDPLGRAGIRARVNTHFFERFAGAILQSALDIGVNLAARAGTGTVVVLPGGLTTGATAQIVQPAQVTPTLTVRQGTSISIFVARDLDFTGVENRR
jgi:type IV secretion system protein VirB10